MQNLEDDVKKAFKGITTDFIGQRGRLMSESGGVGVSRWAGFKGDL